MGRDEILNEKRKQRIPSVAISAVVLALVSTFCALVNVQTPGLLPQLVTISAGASVRTRTVPTDLLAATPITRALVDVFTAFGSVIVTNLFKCKVMHSLSEPPQNEMIISIVTLIPPPPPSP